MPEAMDGERAQESEQGQKTTDRPGATKSTRPSEGASLDYSLVTVVSPAKGEKRELNALADQGSDTIAIVDRALGLTRRLFPLTDCCPDKQRGTKRPLE